jgi:hypothetical protein
VVQHAAAGTPYPLGRTALFLWPPLVGQMVLTLDRAAASARMAPGVAALLVVLACGAVWHAARVGNVERAFDWPLDGCTPAMLSRVASGGPAPIRLGVAWQYYPVAAYYSERWRGIYGAIDPIVLPGDGLRLDYAYAPAHEIPPGEVITRYPDCDAVLARMQR